MFTHIMVPIDMAETEQSQHSVSVAAEFTRHFGARLTFISITGGLQGKVSHNHTRYAARLAEFAAGVGSEHGIEVETRCDSVPDPSVEVDRKLREAIVELGVDLVVMATHQPGWTDHIVNSHGGRLARYAPVSVFLVREPAAPDVLATPDAG